MKKLLIIFIVTLIHSLLQGQISGIFTDEFPDLAKTRIGIVGDYDLNSNTFTNTFISKFYTGGHIDEGMKNSISNRAKNKNRIGGNVNYGIYVAIKPDSAQHKKKYISYFFSVRDRTHFDSHFSKDLFRVGFYGNSEYAGKTAYFNDFSLNLIHYQQLQVGIFSSKVDSAARWGLGISFLKGESYLSVDAPKAELYTSEDGQYIDFSTQMSVNLSDTAKKGLGAFNGFGASLDVYFEAPFQTRFGNSKLRLAVSDIGFIRFNKQSLTLQEDTVFHYTGFHVNSFYDLQDSTYGNTSQDSIINTVAPFKKKAFSANLPSVLDLTYETQFSKRFYLTEGIRYVFNANYSLLGYIKGNFYLSPKFMLSATFGYGGYGGYGNFNYGLGLFANFGHGVVLYAGSNNLEGYLTPKTNAGQGVYISLIKNFK